MLSFCGFGFGFSSLAIFSSFCVFFWIILLAWIKLTSGGQDSSFFTSLGWMLSFCGFGFGFSSLATLSESDLSFSKSMTAGLIRAETDLAFNFCVFFWIVLLAWIKLTSGGEVVSFFSDLGWIFNSDTSNAGLGLRFCSIAFCFCGFGFVFSNLAFTLSESVLSFPKFITAGLIRAETELAFNRSELCELCWSNCMCLSNLQVPKNTLLHLPFLQVSFPM